MRNGGGIEKNHKTAPFVRWNHRQKFIIRFSFSHRHFDGFQGEPRKSDFPDIFLVINPSTSSHIASHMRAANCQSPFFPSSTAHCGL